MRWLPVLLCSSLLTAEAAGNFSTPGKPPAGGRTFQNSPCGSPFQYNLSVDILYWGAKEHRLNYANQFLSYLRTTDFTLSPLLKPKFSSSVGARGAFARMAKGEGFGFVIKDTYIKNSFLEHLNTGTILTTVDDNSPAFFPVQSMASSLLSTDSVFAASSKWTAFVNLIDALATYRLCIGSKLSYTPFAGLRSAWVDQTNDVQYSGGMFATGTDEIEIKNNYWGAGPSAGIRFDIHPSEWWNVGIGGSLSALLGQFHIRQQEAYFNRVQFYSDQHTFKARWIADAQVGARGYIPIVRDKYRIGIEAGYDFLFLPGQSQWKENSFNLLSSNRSLSFFGWFFSAHFQW